MISAVFAKFPSPILSQPLTNRKNLLVTQAVICGLHTAPLSQARRRPSLVPSPSGPSVCRLQY